MCGGEGRRESLTRPRTRALGGDLYGEVFEFLTPLDSESTGACLGPTSFSTSLLVVFE